MDHVMEVCYGLHGCYGQLVGGILYPTRISFWEGQTCQFITEATTNL